MKSRQFHHSLFLMIMLFISACTVSNPAGPATTPSVSEADATVTVTSAPTPIVEATTTARPSPTTAHTATAIPTPSAPAISGLTTFITSLETAIQDHDPAEMAAHMSDPFALGAWRSEWRSLPPQAAASEIINQHTPAGGETLFSDLSLEDIATLLDGQDPQQMMGPDVSVATVLHGDGWGPAGDEEVMLFIVEDEFATYSFQAFLYVPGSFNPETVASEYPPIETLVITNTENTSPDGVWIATIQESEVVNMEDGSQFFYNAITVSDGTRTWEPAGEWRGYGLGVAYLNLYRWGADGRTLYYGNAATPDGCALFAYETDLSRLDLETGEITELIPAYSAWYLNLSPDESILASISWDGVQVWLALLNPETGAESRIPLTEGGEFAQAGNLVWSPDGQMALLTLAYDPCGPDWTHSTVLVDPAGLTTQTLIDRDPRLFTISEWPTENEAILLDDEGNRWQLNISTSEMVPLS